MKTVLVAFAGRERKGSLWSRGLKLAEAALLVSRIYTIETKFIATLRGITCENNLLFVADSNEKSK